MWPFAPKCSHKQQLKVLRLLNSLKLHLFRFLNWLKFYRSSYIEMKTAGRNINNLRNADDTTLKAESEEKLKCFLMRV